MLSITRSAGRTAGLLVGIVVVCLVVAATLFPRAFPTVALANRIPRAEALSKADSVFSARALTTSSSRRAVSFEADDSLLTFVDLAGGGKDTLESLVRGDDATPYTWSVRAFTPEDPHEARVDFNPAGRVVGFERKLAEADKRPTLSADSARVIAQTILTTWLNEPLPRWKLATSSYDARKTSGRVDHTLTFERVGRTVAHAPIRLDIVVAGDLPAKAHRYVVIPESFRVRYREMRTANELLQIIDTIAVLGLIIAVIVVLRRRSRERSVRWREAFVVGSVVGVLLVAAGLNDMPLAWFNYDTATSPLVFQAVQLVGAIAGGITMGIVVALTLAAAEASARRAFPNHLDWWKLWRARGTREVAGRVLGGYTVAALALAYVTVFYLITRNLFGWWVPAEMLDDPNQIATPLPWITGIGLSLQAGVWEETLFRALPLSLLALWVGDRPHRRWWMAAGVVGTALIFGFAHSNYQSWPPYSRGIEIFIDAAFWAVIVIQFGALVTIIGHFLYDLMLFGLFAAAGSAAAYRISAVIIGLAILAPAIVILWKWARQRGLATATSEERFAAWTPAPPAPPAEAPPLRRSITISPLVERVVAALSLAAIVVAIVAPADPVLGPRFTVSRQRATAVADSMLRAHGGVDPSSWRRLTGIGTDTLAAWPRFLRANHASHLASALSSTYAVPTWWTVRYVHADGPLMARIEEWRVRVRPDGTPLDLRHIVPDSAPGGSPSDDDVRRIARTALTGAGLDPGRLRETKLDVTARPLRHDATITYTDSSVLLPDSAAARVWVSLAGTEPLVVRRGIELPEVFVRKDKKREELRFSIAGGALLLLMGGLITGIVLIIRQRPTLVSDALVSRRTLGWLVFALAITTIIEAINSLPSALFDYDSASTWNNFTSKVGVQMAFAAIPALLLLGIWLVTRALRQRVGIPAGSLGASEPPLRTSIVAGLGLGAVFGLVSLLGGAAASDIPPAPHTALNDLLPWLAPSLSLLVLVATSVAATPIPFLVIGGASRRWKIRILLLVVVALLLAAVGASAADRAISIPKAILSVAALAALAYAIPMWGAVSVMAWVVAALTESVFTSIHGAVHGPTGPERLGALLLALFALAIVVVIPIMQTRSRRNPALNSSRA